MSVSLRPTFILACLAAIAASVSAACHGDPVDPCVPIANGVVVFLPGIQLLVRDSAGRGAALGDSVTVYGARDSVRTVGNDTLQIQAGFGTTGSFSVRVRRPFYRDAVVENVVVAGGQCGGPVTTVVPVTLSLVAGAPPLRSIAIEGFPFVNGPGAHYQLSARFDADATVPRTVLWRINDTTDVRVDANGLLTGKCTTKSRTDTVTALATADTMVRAQARFSVASQATCP